MVAPLVWGAFLASEAFAKGERDDFAKQQAEANRPKTIYFKLSDFFNVFMVKIDAIAVIKNRKNGRASIVCKL